MERTAYTDHVAYAVADRRERRVAFASVGVALILAILAVSTRSLTQPILALQPLIALGMSAMATTLIITAAILRNQYRASYIPSFAFLGTAYAVAAFFVVTTAFMLVPAAFAIGTGPLPQVAVWLWAMWHIAFVLLTGGYLFGRGHVAALDFDARRRRDFVRRYVAVVGVLAVLSAGAIVAIGSHLPVLIEGGRFTTLFDLLVEGLLMPACLLMLVALYIRTRFRETTHLWLSAVLVTFLLENATVGAVAQAPDTISWFLARGIGWYGITLYLSAQLRHLHQLLAAYAAKTDDLERETMRDALTELFNRRGFDAQCAKSLKECDEQREPLSLLILDLDHFKLYNDCFGHITGDNALRTIARTLTSVANRPRDAVCRVGGEEFAVLLPATDTRGAIAVGERMREAVMRVKIPHAPSAPLPIVTISIGFASVDASDVPATTSLSLYSAADAALYRSKAGGRNRVSGSNAVPTRPVEPPASALEMQAAKP